MAIVTLTITCKVDTGLAMSCDELKTKYATDIDFEGLAGQRLTCATIEQKIKIEQVKLQNMLDIKIAKIKLQEKQDYSKYEFAEWGYIQCMYNIKEILSIGGYIRNREVLTIENDWVDIKEQEDQFRNLYIMPSDSGLWHTNLAALVFRHGYNSDFVPNFWRLEYLSGFDNIPLDLLEAIGKLTMLQVYNILGNILFGVGIASTSKGIDGLSQSVGTTQSATNALFGASITTLEDQLKYEIPALKGKYKGLAAVRL